MEVAAGDPRVAVGGEAVDLGARGLDEAFDARGLDEHRDRNHGAHRDQKPSQPSRVTGLQQGPDRQRESRVDEVLRDADPIELQAHDPGEEAECRCPGDQRPANQQGAREVVQAGTPLHQDADRQRRDQNRHQGVDGEPGTAERDVFGET